MSSDDNEDSIVSLIYSPDECQFHFNKEAAFEMVLIRLKEPLTEDADARESAAHGGGGPVRSIIHHVIQMLSARVRREDLPPTYRDASVKFELLMMKRNSIEYSFNSLAPFSV